MTRDQEIAWAAGLFEGEGSFVARRKQNTPKMYFSAHVVMTDEETVRRFHEVVGLGIVNGPYTYGKPEWKPSWRWNGYGPAGKQVAEMLRPFLGSRRTQRLDEILSLTE